MNDQKKVEEVNDFFDEVANVGMPISAHDFANRTTSGARVTTGHSFGVSQDAAVRTLRALADRIESRSTLVQSVQVKSFAKVDGFTTTELYIEIVEQKS